MEELRRLREEVAKYKAAEEQQKQQTGQRQEHPEINQQQQGHLGNNQQQQHLGNNQLQQQHLGNNQHLQHGPPTQDLAGAAALMAQGVVTQFSGVGGASNNSSTSSILPKVSLDVKKKIWANQYIALETLLRNDDPDVEGGKMLLMFDPTNPSNPMSLSKKRPPKIASWQQWIEAYQVLMFTMLENKPDRARELVGYQCIIMEAASKFPLNTWMKYDERFRKSAAEDPSKRWDQIDVQLWVVSFTLPPRALCNVCHSPSHWARDCPAKLLKSGPSRVKPKPAASRSDQGAFCFGFNSPRGCQGESINDFISKTDFSVKYVTIDDAIAMLKRLAEEKTEGPSQVLVFMGIELDSVTQEARLPLDKLQRLKSSFLNWGSRTRCTLKELQSLIGVLNWVCAIIPAGRAFLQPSEENGIADALSRFQMDRFRQLAPKAAPVSCSIPESLMLT
ncbi:hypothetical protein Bbelb_266660 [Branchiostoma belcheri]|nr:hypothetical protein Bbelb_266660 [Branchiostoma belcheri]